jgi:hypothetical protein
VAGPRQVARLRLRVDRGQHRARAVGGRDARGRPLLRLDRHAERGAELRVVLLVADHQRDAQRVEPLAGHGQADQAAAVAGHEVDDVGRHLLRRDREIPFVLAVLVVHDHDHAPVADVRDRRRYVAEGTGLHRFDRPPLLASALPEQPLDVFGEDVGL